MTDQQPMYSQRCARCGYARINVRHETDREHSPEGLAYFADADVPFCEFQAVTDPMLDHMGHRSEERAVTDPKPLAADGEAALRDHLSRAIDGDSYTPHLVARLLATLDAERAERDAGEEPHVYKCCPHGHEDDSYGDCTICMEYVPHTDNLYRKVKFPCAVVRERAAPAPALDADKASKYGDRISGDLEDDEGIEALDDAERAARDGGLRETHRPLNDYCRVCSQLWPCSTHLRAALAAPAPALDRERLARALHGLWRTFWSESKGVGWHYKMWADEDVFPHFDDGTLADAIADAYEREDGA